MKLFAKPVEVDPIYLLLHGPRKYASHPFDDSALADAINQRIADALSLGGKLARLEMVPPSETGLSRWMLRWEFSGGAEESYFADCGLSAPSQVRFGLPAEVVSVLRAMAAWTVEVK